MSPLRRLRRTAVRAGCLAVALALLLAASASAAAPAWTIHSTANTKAAPGSEFSYWISAINSGTAPTDHTAITLRADLPPDVTLVSAPGLFAGFGGVTCPGASPGDTTFTCETTRVLLVGEVVGENAPRIVVAVDPGAAPGNRTAEFSVEGGGAAASASTVDPTMISAEPTPFGVDAFDFQPAADAAGTPATAAGSHPYEVSTLVNVNTHARQRSGFPGVFGLGERDPVEPVRDIDVDLPPGFVGYTRGLAECTQVELANSSASSAKPLCPEASQVGTITVRANNQLYPDVFPGKNAVYNLQPPRGSAARFGFNAAGTVVVIDAFVRSGSDYGVTLGAHRISEGINLIGNEIEFWGVPAGTVHDKERACKGQGAPYANGNLFTCSAEVEEAAFVRLPTSCTEPETGLPATARVDSWYHPNAFATRTIHTHALPGQPLAPEDWGPELGTEDCGDVPFEPSLSVKPTTQAADSPSGLEVELSLPQEQDPDQIDQSDLRKAVVTLPEGMTLNPSSAGGLGSCSTSQVGLLGTSFPQPYPVHFTPDSASCPNSSKIGTVEIETPGLNHSLEGNVFLASQGDNPFGSLLAMYVVVEDAASGLVLKLPGLIETDPQTGRLVTTFDANPQLPFETLRLKLFSGPRAALRTPAACGTYGADGTFTPWSGNPPVQLSSSFRITSCGNGGFDPKLSAGTQTPTAGAYSPFTLRLTRDDGSQEFGALQVSLPPGLVGSLRGYSYCADSALAAISGSLGTGKGQEASPSCPASSLVGSATVGAGAGANPFYTETGRAYIAGPYKGASVSLAVVAPAVAGPFDLGSVVVRNAIHVDPTSAQLTVDSDPLPTVLHGIPLDLRDIRVKYNTTLNPTSCEPMEFTSKVTSTKGATATPSAYFQATGCDRLGFKPRLSLQLKGPTHRAAHPALHAVLRARPGDANIGSAIVLLPKTELLENAHIRTICTRVQFAADGGGGAGCPEGSIYGFAKASTPLLDQPLQGPVFLRSNGGERELPDLVAALDGQIHVDVVGYIDSVHARIRNRFMTTPDAPVTKFELTMQGGKKGLLANNTELCRAKPHATALFNGQNGRSALQQPLVKAKCGAGKRGGRSRR